MKKIRHEAYLITKKDFASKQVEMPSIILMLGLVLLVIFSAVSGMEGILMPNAICWFVLPIAIGPIVAVPVGNNILQSERKTNMLEVLLVSGVNPISFVIGKSIKPFVWGIFGTLVSEVAAQCAFAATGSGFILYPLSFPFVLCLILGTALAALMITGFAIAYANEMFIGGVIFSIVIAPPLLIGNIFYSLGIGLAFQASALLAVVYALLCAIAFLFSLRLLKQGSKYRLTSS